MLLKYFKDLKPQAVIMKSPSIKKKSGENINQ